MKENKQAEQRTENTLEQPRSNNNLLIILGVLVLIIIGLVVYAIMPGKAPSSLVDQAAQLSPVESAAAEQEEEVTILPVVNQPEPTKAPLPADNPGKAAAAPKTSGKVSSKEYVHTVKAGETLFNITQRYNVPQQEFKDLNYLADNNLRIGQQVKVKVTAIHEVSPGEGLKAIAEKYQVNKELIKKANALPDESLQLNQQLIIPLP